MPFLRLLCYVVEPEKRCVGKCDRVCADLIVAFIVAEEEEFILLDRPAQRAAILSADKERVKHTSARIRCRIVAQRADGKAVESFFGGPTEAWEGRHVMVAVKEKSAPVQVIAACARNNVN